ncbi:MAG TPA: tetratricopeptide repeat protein, partial [Vicinamibacteria bacterium]
MSILAASLMLVVSSQVPAAVAAASPSSRAEAYYHFSVGLQARLSGDSDEALAAYRRAQKLDPASSSIRVETARLLREMGRLDEAQQEAEAAVGLDKDDADAHQILAQLEQIQAAGPAAQEALRRAAAQYEEVARIRPTDGQS